MYGFKSIEHNELQTTVTKGKKHSLHLKNINKEFNIEYRLNYSHLIDLHSHSLNMLGTVTVC